MIKDLVVDLGVGTPNDVAADHAIAIAAAFDAHPTSRSRRRA